MSEPWDGVQPDRRRHARVQLSAFAEATFTNQLLLLPVHNLSLGGALLLPAGHDVSQFLVRTRHYFVLIAPDDLTRRLALAGEILRHDTRGVALKWVVDDAAFARLADWIRQSSR